MSTLQDQNKAIIAKYFSEYWGKLNADIVDELCADDFFQSYPMHGNPKKGKEAAKQAMVDFKAAFPNLTFQSYGPYGLIAEGDYVFGRWIGGGKQTGEAFDDFVVGELGKNTGREMWFSGMTVFTLKDGKIEREIGEEGGLTALQQLGLIEGAKQGRGPFLDVESM
jgi:hypothetical protein